MLPRSLAFVLLALMAVSASADAWLDSLQAQQRALYRLTGTFYMSTHEDAESELLAALPTRITDYRQAFETSDKLSGSNRLHAQKMQLIREAWSPLEGLVTSNIQQVIGKEQKKYINNGAFNAFQRATDVSNQMPTLESALGQAVLGAAGNDTRPAIFMQAAVACEALAAQYARSATGFFEDAKKAGSDAPLKVAANNFETALTRTRALIDESDAMQRVPFDRIEARWKFVRPTLVKPSASGPRIVYRYLNEISDNFAKLATAPATAP